VKLLSQFKKAIKNLLFFKEPEKVNDFILKENKKESLERQSDESGKDAEEKVENRKVSMKKTTEQPDENNGQNKEKSEKKSEKTSEISKRLSDNLEYIKKVYTIPLNGDVILREFDVVVNNKAISAFIIFIDGMTDRNVINNDILLPLMLLSNLDIKSEEKDTATYVRNHLLTHNQVKEVTEYKKVIDEVDFGGCGVFIDGMDSAFAADVKGWEHRGVERPNTELLIRGPQEGFNEILRVNTALVRKILKDKDLICENIEIGEKSQTPCSLLYIKNIANDSLVAEVRRRLKSIKVDYLHDSGELEQFIEDNTYNFAPQMFATERPDRVASALTEGKISVVVHGSPFVLVMPTTAIELIHTPEDTYFRFPYGSFLRVIRIIGVLMSLLLPAFYIAITSFHQEMIPTSLLLAIEASREKVPFPSVVEILIMEFAFELIREAGIRIPGPIGPTLGIIGALILGQAAVAANIVSPILIIVVAVTGIGSFAIPNFSLALSFRMLRFVYIILGATVGFLGITIGLFIHGMLMVSAKSFGVPFLVPFAPKTFGKLANVLLRSPIWKQEKRLDYLNTKDERSQPEISRGWIKGKGREDGNNGK
jgi:spore germination protein KA